MPRPYDQRHTVDLQATYRLARDWNLAVAWKYHSGWPATEWTYDQVTRPAFIGGRPSTSRHEGLTLLPRLPTIGLRWEFRGYVNLPLERSRVWRASDLVFKILTAH
jgi:hypothetical protein